MDTEATEAEPVARTSRKRGPSKSLKGKATEAIVDAAQSGEVRAARAIGRTLLAVDEADAKLAEERKAWAARIGAARATLRGTIEADDDGTDEGARAKLDGIVAAYQETEEAEAGRKDALHLLIERRKEVRARLKQQIEGARQLGLFDDET